MHDNTFIPQVCLVSFECTVQGLGISLSKARDHKDLTMSVIRTVTVTITGLREFFCKDDKIKIPNRRTWRWVVLPFDQLPQNQKLIHHHHHHQH